MNKKSIKHFYYDIVIKNKDRIMSFLIKVVELFFTGVVFAVIASLLTTEIIDKKESEKIARAQFDGLSKIYIGCNKQWADDTFGTPQFVGNKGEYLLCAYISDSYVIQMAFDKANSAQAYLITTLHNDSNIKIEINDETLWLDEDYILGEFSYYDFPGKPINVFGFVTNGNGRVLYMESYYFMGGGNYYDYYIGFLDFGELINDKWPDIDIIDGDIDDEVTADKSLRMFAITNRSDNYPNSYGVSALGMDIYEILFSYDWFNSQQIRNRLNS